MSKRVLSIFSAGIIVGAILTGLGVETARRNKEAVPRGTTVAKIVEWRGHYVQVPPRWSIEAQPTVVVIRSDDLPACFLRLRQIAVLPKGESLEAARTLVASEYRVKEDALRKGVNHYGHTLWYVKRTSAANSNEFVLVAGDDILGGETRWVNSQLGRTLAAEMGQIQAWFGPRKDEIPPRLLDDWHAANADDPSAPAPLSPA